MDRQSFQDNEIDLRRVTLRPTFGEVEHQHSWGNADYWPGSDERD